MTGFEWIIILMLFGAFVGFMAGLLGIGGGGIMVPVLTSIFLMQGVPVENVVHLALGTAMASIIITSISSLRAHHAKGAVLWAIVKQMSPGILLGTFLATFLAAHLNSLYLAIFFACFMAYVSLQMFINKKPKPSRELMGTGGMFLSGAGIGAISALVSIGGGSLTVPYLTWQNVDIRKSIATSAAIGLPISLAGTLGYLINGWSNTSLENYIFGYISLIPVALISVVSFVTAPMGASLAHKLPIPILKKIFALLLISLSIKMLTSIW